MVDWRPVLPYYLNSGLADQLLRFFAMIHSPTCQHALRALIYLAHKNSARRASDRTCISAVDHGVSA